MKVKCIDQKGCWFIKLGEIYEVEEKDWNSGSGFVLIKDRNKTYKRNRFEIIENDNGEKEMDNKKREFNFVLPSIVAYKRSEWEQDLTRENPLIVTRIDGVTDFMIHGLILDKARFLKIGLPLITNTDKDISALTEWVKWIKSCDWDDKKVNVKVIIPKI